MSNSAVDSRRTGFLPELDTIGMAGEDAEILPPNDAPPNGIATALSATGINLWVHCTEAKRTSYYAPAGNAGTGVSGCAGTFDPSAIRVHLEDQDKVDVAIAQIASGQGTQEMRYRVEDDTGEVRWIRTVGSLVQGSFPPRIAGVSIDVTTEVAVQQDHLLLLQEAEHRLKNLFAVAASLVSLVARQHQEVPSFANDIFERFAALARAHGTMWQNTGRTPSLFKLVDTLLSPYRGHTKIHFAGPEILLDPLAVTSISLIVHEWATNSVKYGALGSRHAAHLDISWDIDGAQLTILWLETAPEVTEAKSPSGFGSHMVEAAAKRISGTVTKMYFHQQLALSIVIPGIHFTKAGPGH